MDKRHIYDPDIDRRHSYAERIRLSAALSLWIEALIKALWRPVSWMAMLCGVMMLSLPSFFGELGWMVTGSAFWIGAVYLLIEDFKTFKAPSKNAVLRRVQQDNKLPYRPLEVMTDTPAGLFTTSKRRLWNAALTRAEQDSKTIKTSLPSLCASLWDVRGLRIMALITFIAGIIIAGGSGYDRIMRGLFPFGGLGSNEGLSYTIWISPPDYTGLNDIVLDNDSAAQNGPAPIIPEGSTIKSTVNGLWGPAWLKLHIDSIGKTNTESFTHSDNESFTAEMNVPDFDIPELPPMVEPGAESMPDADFMQESASLSLRNLLRHFAEYPVNYRPDHSPTILWQEEENSFIPEDEEETDNADIAESDAVEPDPFMDAPQKNTAGADREHGMSFPITMQDDYGIENIELVIALAPAIQDKPAYKGETVFVKPMNTPAGRPYNANSFFDLSDHPWAGLPVIISIRAVDAAGQKTATPTREYTLRERPFTQLLAQRLVYLRKKLIWQGIDAARTVAFDLRFQLQYPEDMRDDPSIWLALKTVRERLKNAKTNEDVFPLIDTLWDIALDLEDMGLSKAARDLDRATRKITRAMRRDPVDNDKVMELFDDYKNSMSDYLDKLREFNENRDIDRDSIPQEILRDLLNPQPLQEMLNQMEDLANQGDYESLEDMIADLQALLESFALGGGMPPDLEAMEKGLNVLQGLIDNQKQLLSDTEDLAELVPQSAKMPKKGFGQALEPEKNVIDSWNQGDMPPAPGMTLDNFFDRREGMLDLDNTEDDIDQSPEADEPSNAPDENGPSVPPLTIPEMTQPNTNNGDEWQPALPPKDDFVNRDIIDDSLPETQEQEDIQEVLRFILGELMGELYEFTGEYPETMPLAELEMRKSTRTLDKRRPDESVPVQEEVIRLLEQAQEELQQQMQDQMQQRSGMAARRPSPTDPLGRPTEPEDEIYSENSDVEVPESFEKRRIDEILEYLRKHSGDPDRPRIEREYFKRLLENF